MDTLRWITDASLDGPANMARDEALLTRVGAGQAPPTLRFYYWDPPTISLGYFQTYADYESLAPPAGRLAVVRRQTGGGAILHDRELTYSLALPLGHPLLRTHPAALSEISGCGEPPTGNGLPNAASLYRHVHSAAAELLACLGVPVTFGPNDPGHSAQRGPFFCFERHAGFDLLAEGRKIMGSAQRRTPAAILQHGSLMLDRRYDQQQCATLRDFTPALLNQHLRDLAAAIAAPCSLSPGQWAEEELALADRFRFKYAGRDWTCQR